MRGLSNRGVLCQKNHCRLCDCSPRRDVCVPNGVICTTAAMLVCYKAVLCVVYRSFWVNQPSSRATILFMGGGTTVRSTPATTVTSRLTARLLV